MVYKFLESRYDVKRQKTFDWCKNPSSGCKYRFDFYILKKNVLIEVDGRQHFEQVMNWDRPDETRLNDVFKMKTAMYYGKRIIRILQIDVARTEIWKERLIDAIESDDKITYISQGNKYDQHKEDMTEPEPEKIDFSSLIDDLDD